MLSCVTPATSAPYCFSWAPPWALVPYGLWSLRGLASALLLLRTRWEDQRLQAELPGHKDLLYAHVYESPCFVKKERIIRASVNLPFVYPSIGVSLAPVGCFEVALAAPSVNEPKAQ